jgi:hypothetical protein
MMLKVSKGVVKKIEDYWNEDSYLQRTDEKSTDAESCTRIRVYKASLWMLSSFLRFTQFCGRPKGTKIC